MKGSCPSLLPSCQGKELIIIFSVFLHNVFLLWHLVILWFCCSFLSLLDLDIFFYCFIFPIVFVGSKIVLNFVNSKHPYPILRILSRVHWALELWEWRFVFWFFWVLSSPQLVLLPVSYQAVIVAWSLTVLYW